MNLDTILWLIGLSAEIGVVALCVKGKLYRITPVFCAYMGWSLVIDILFYFLNRSPNYFRSEAYLRFYSIEMVLDSIFQFAVLVELGWAVLRPIRSSLPRYSLLILSLLFAVLFGLIWPISAHMLPQGLLGYGTLFVHGQQTIAVLRVVIFMALAGFSQLLAIGWKNRELQIATGLGFYSMCTLAISIIHSHQNLTGRGWYYHVLDQVGVASYICSMIYWIFSFAQQEQERQQFTPEMRNFLLAVTGGGRGPHRPV